MQGWPGSFAGVPATPMAITRRWVGLAAGRDRRGWGATDAKLSGGAGETLNAKAPGGLQYPTGSR